MKEKGATLYFAVLIMSILMAAVFSMGSLVLVQIKIIKGMGNSIIAYYAADTGAERVLDELYNGNITKEYYEEIDGPSYSYKVFVVRPMGGVLTVLDEDANCTSEYYCIKSVGTYNNTRRAVEVSG